MQYKSPKEPSSILNFDGIHSSSSAVVAGSNVPVATEPPGSSTTQMPTATIWRDLEAAAALAMLCKNTNELGTRRSSSMLPIETTELSSTEQWGVSKQSNEAETQGDTPQSLVRNNDAGEGTPQISTDPFPGAAACSWRGVTSSTPAMNKKSPSRTIVEGDQDTTYDTRFLTRTFPEKLFEMLSSYEENEVADAKQARPIVWAPHGRCFYIKNQELFAATILPRFFKQSKFKSFTRKLYRWGFRQITTGPDTNSFYHELFRRDNRNLCLRMRCNYSDKERQQHRCKSLRRSNIVVGDTNNKKKSQQETDPTMSALDQVMQQNGRTFLPITEQYKKPQRCRIPSTFFDLLEQPQIIEGLPSSSVQQNTVLSVLVSNLGNTSRMQLLQQPRQVYSVCSPAMSHE